MPFSKDSSSKDETSGLHDLQAMASSAKKRRSQRLSSQMDAQDSLLQSTAALEAVVLPDPSKEQAVSIAEVSGPANAAASTSATLDAVSSASAVTPAAELGESKSSSGKGLYVGLALAAVAAAGTFFLLGGKEDKKVAESTAKPVAASAAAPSDIDPTPDLEAPAHPAVVEDDLDETDDGETDSGEPSVTAVDGDSGDELVKEKVVATTTEKTSEKKSVTSKAKAKAESQKGDKSKTKVAAAATSKAATSKKVEPKKAEKKLDSSASLDDVLSSVTGGVNKPIAKKEDTGPSLTKLGRSDVAKAMKRITPAAKACYKVEEFSGMVKIKYSVGPDGKVTKASASGAHSGSKTGACVVKAVKKAKFPPFSGATMSFAFPFLLSP